MIIHMDLVSTIANIFKRKKDNIIIKDNTFVVWEPCSKSHSEVVPGYVKYLLDLGYHVSVVVHPDRYKEGLFSRFHEENVSYNRISPVKIKKYFQKSNLSNIKGLMVTTIGKLCDSINYDEVYFHFAPDVDKSKILMVEHEASYAADKGSWRDKNITLRELNYKGIKSVVVNPHYFGDVNISPKNKITNFITIGAIRPCRKNSALIVEAVEKLHKKGITNFKVTVIGKGHLKGVAKEIRKYFDIKGRLPFDKMYDEIEKSDFMLTAYDDNDTEHIRYNTSGTSGNFQLVYGFLKPCIIVESFAPINGFNKENSITYKTVNDYSDALEVAINLSNEDYQKMQASLKKYSDKLYNSSLENLKTLLSEKGEN